MTDTEDPGQERGAAERSTASLRLPPIAKTRVGEYRRLGVEIELIGLELDLLSALVAEVVGAQRVEKTRYRHVAAEGIAGDWVIELDFRFLRKMGETGESSPLESMAVDLLSLGAEQVVPLEVVTPPLPMNRLGVVERLITRLRAAGARGTGDGLMYAFALQLNPELPSLDAATITRYLKAFLCLFDWLKERSQVDLTRRLTSFADAFPGEYVRSTADPDYEPALETLIDDYLASNPTRNRALDCLPLFAHLDARRVRAAVDDPRIKARPTLHYRLPNCDVGREGWGLGAAWNDWLEVERLAADPDRLRALCELYTAYLDRPIERWLESWTEEVTRWLTPPADR